ncbi:hypothetical protein C9374_012024 [Naegleria lovaniensis]|uniref:Uncharacterized protein n=1 Tax=Naegleria lovaniensis TaxID=51637 RepID=A0AA88GGD0_NAELO|nr:uncharacterized protein C9374_012024 [Naegleria lovaniensis]KAG2373561.1 hypothetical protein C9374_012024 [Naegleria lovaniensis]
MRALDFLVPLMLLALLSLNCCLVRSQSVPSHSLYDNPGKSVKNTLEKGAIDYFLVNVSSWNIGMSDFLVFGLNSLSGDVDLWVSTTQFPTSSDCNGCIHTDIAGYSDSRLINRNDETNWPASNVFYIAVVASFRKSAYSLASWSSNVQVALESNVALLGQSPKGRDNYFVYEIPQGASHITITVTSQTSSSDPDLYISGSIPKPNATHNDWTCADYGFDSVLVHVEPGLTHIYINVNAFTDSIYTVLVRLNDDAVQLSEGMLLDDLLDEGQMDIFYFENLHTQNIVVESLEVNSEGESKLYVRYGQPPTSVEFDQVVSLEGNDYLIIKNASVGTYYFGLYGLVNGTGYKIWCYTEDPNQIVVSENNALGGVLSSSSNFVFKFESRDFTQGIVAKVEAIEKPIQMYYAQHSRPTNFKYVKTTTATVGNSAMLYLAPPSPTPYLYFSLFGEGKFTFEITTNHTTKELFDGIEMDMEWVPRGYYRYYMFKAEKFPDQAITITANPYRYNDVDIYVSTSEPHPSESNHQWKGEERGVDTIYIPAKASEAKGNVFYISVFAYDTDCYFSLVASYAGESRILKLDEAISSTVSEESYSYFTLEVALPGKVLINLQLQNSGDQADLYYSTTVATPNKYNYEGKGSNLGGSVLTIDDVQPGKVYVSVHGALSTSLNKLIPFKIIASNSYLYTYPNGDAIPMVSKKGTINIFKASITNSLRILIASVSLVKGKTAMYVTNNGWTGNSTYYTWKDSNAVGNSIVIKNSDPKFALGTWTIAVESLEDSEYHFSMASNIGANVLEDVHTIGRTPSDGNMDSLIYNFWLPFKSEQSKTDIVIHIKELEGKVNIYANQDMQHDPSPTSFKWKSETNGDQKRSIVIKKEELNIQNAIYVLVQGEVGKSSLYSIAFSKHTSSQDSDNTAGIVVGVVLGVVMLALVVVLAVGLVVYFRKRKQASTYNKFDQESQQAPEGSSSVYYKVENTQN